MQRWNLRLRAKPPLLLNALASVAKAIILYPITQSRLGNSLELPNLLWVVSYKLPKVNWVTWLKITQSALGNFLMSALVCMIETIENTTLWKRHKFLPL